MRRRGARTRHGRRASTAANPGKPVALGEIDAVQGSEQESGEAGRLL
jgi:hypothetical protein